MPKVHPEKTKDASTHQRKGCSCNTAYAGKLEAYFSELGLLRETIQCLLYCEVSHDLLTATVYSSVFGKILQAFHPRTHASSRDATATENLHGVIGHEPSHACGLVLEQSYGHQLLHHKFP